MKNMGTRCRQFPLCVIVELLLLIITLHEGTTEIFLVFTQHVDNFTIVYTVKPM